MGVNDLWGGPMQKLSFDDPGHHLQWKGFAWWVKFST